MSKAWDNLSMSEKSEMIRVAIKNGITNLGEIRQKYNEFAEGGNLYAGGGNTDDDLVDWIIREEGFLSTPKDIGDGKMTLGSGLTSSKWHELYKRRGNKWSKEDNRRAVAEEVANRRRWAEANIPNWDTLPKSSQKALLSYKYNYDFTKSNSPKLFKALEDSDLQEAARQMDATSKIPAFRKGLEARRRREQQWFLSDVVPPAPSRSYNPAPVDNTYMYNPFSVEIEQSQALPIMVPDTDRYITAHEITPAQDKAEKYYEQAENMRRFNALMEMMSIPNNPRPQYVPKSNLHFSAQGPLIDYAIRANGGHIYDGTSETSNQMIRPVTTGGTGYIPPLDAESVANRMSDPTPRYMGIDLTFGLPIDTVRRRLYDNLSPVSYDHPVMRYIKAVKKNKSEGNYKTRDDIWATYLQIPKEERHDLGWEHDKVVESEYRPSKGDDENIKTYYRIDKPVFFFGSPSDDLWPHVFNDVYHDYKRSGRKMKPLAVGENRVIPVSGDTESRTGMLEQYFKDYTVGHGRDKKGEYISYYDKWDINPMFGYGDISDGIGKPVHFYDRKYLGDYYGLPEDAWTDTFLDEIIVTPKNK